jgi:hypothetical protein
MAACEPFLEKSRLMRTVTARASRNTPRRSAQQTQGGFQMRTRITQVLLSPIRLTTTSPGRASLTPNAVGKPVPSARTQAHLDGHLARLPAGGMESADEHGGRQSVIRARSRRNGHQIIIRGSCRSPVPGESERCKTTRRPTAGWRPARIAPALAVGEEPPPSRRRAECGSGYAAAARLSSNTARPRARSRTTRRRVTAMIARFLPVRGVSRS